MGLSRGKRREKSNVGLGLSLERGRGTGFPLNSGAFDVMVCEGLHHGFVRRPRSEQTSIKGEGLSLYMLLRISKDRR